MSAKLQLLFLTFSKRLPAYPYRCRWLTTLYLVIRSYTSNYTKNFMVHFTWRETNLLSLFFPVMMYIVYKWYQHINHGRVYVCVRIICVCAGCFIIKNEGSYNLWSSRGSYCVNFAIGCFAIMIDKQRLS